jgi:effector-binding domain-containing protein
MKALKIIGIVVAVLITIVVVVGLIAPKDFDIHREVVINAPQETVWKGISTFEEFNKWNPWSKLDPKMIVKEEGVDGTVGAKHSWKGNKKVGEGSMTLAKIEPYKATEYDLFFADFGSHNTGYYTMEPAGKGQKVTWGMRGHMGFPWNVMMLFMNMDKEGGKDFEEGLANLKAQSESARIAPAYEVKDVDWAEKNALSIRKTVAFQDMPKFFGDNYPKMYQEVAKAGAKPGTALAVFYMYDEKGGKADVAAAVPYEGKKVVSKEYTALNLPAGKAYSMDYYGPYNEKMKEPYKAMDAKLKSMGKTNPDMVIEEYVTDPMTEKDTAKWYTRIYFFSK